MIEGWTGDRIPGDLREAFYRANETLGNEFANEITTSKWTWPQGESPRDIVDDGNLRRSYFARRGVQAGDPIVEHYWPQEYAMAVHEGATFRNGTVLPGRPWTEAPLERGDLEAAFLALARRS